MLACEGFPNEPPCPNVAPEPKLPVLEFSVTVEPKDGSTGIPGFVCPAVEKGEGEGWPLFWATEPKEEKGVAAGLLASGLLKPAKGDWPLELPPNVPLAPPNTEPAGFGALGVWLGVPQGDAFAPMPPVWPKEFGAPKAVPLLDGRPKADIWGPGDASEAGFAGGAPQGDALCPSVELPPNAGLLGWPKAEGPL